jgi:hypothetical protein
MGAMAIFLSKIKALLPIYKSKYLVLAAILMEMQGNYIPQSKSG